MCGPRGFRGCPLEQPHFPTQSFFYPEALVAPGPPRRPQGPEEEGPLGRGGVWWRGWVGTHRVKHLVEGGNPRDLLATPGTSEIHGNSLRVTPYLLEDFGGGVQAREASLPHSGALGRTGRSVEPSPEPTRLETTSGKVSSLKISLPRLVLPTADLLVFPNLRKKIIYKKHFTRITEIHIG